MRDIRELVQLESANSGLAFRSRVYAAGDDETLIRDILALANADRKGPRLLVLGVDDAAGGERTLVGVDRADLVTLKKRLRHLAAKHIEPALTFTLGATQIDDRLIGILCVTDCAARPYLLKAAVAERLPTGIGFVRSGTRTLPLRRADLARMFAREQAMPAADIAVRVGFAGAELRDEIRLAALPIRQLPSELAAERLRAMLDAKETSREAVGQTETHFSRLVHARVYGAETPFEAHTDESLRQRLEHTPEDYGDADEFYMYEVCAHKLRLAACNYGARRLSKVSVRVRLQQIEGIGIAERLYREDGDHSLTGSYPTVTAESSAICLESRLATLAPEHRQVEIFREPPRLWLREPAAGKAVVLDWEVDAHEIQEPVRGSLLIHVDPS